MISFREFKETKHSGQARATHATHARVSISPRHPRRPPPASPTPPCAAACQVIATVKRDALGKFGLTPDTSISLNTEDGASNNKASARILKAKFMVCYPHNLQRCVLIAAGEAGSPSHNTKLKAFISDASKMAVGAGTVN